MKYKIVWTMSNGITSIEPVEFICSNPLLAVKGYVNETLKKTTYAHGIVYPYVEEAPLYINEKPIEKKPVEVKSDLFTGYVKTDINVRNDLSFRPKESSWIEKVSWKSKNYLNGELTISFYNQNEITYVANLSVFNAFEFYVMQGNSAGKYFNKHIKNVLPRI